jgi:hypothetical protein
MDLSSIEQIIRTQIPNAQDNEVELYLNSVKRDMGFGADYSNMSEDDIVEDFEFYIQSKMDIDEAQKPSMKMKKSELKEMIKAAFLSEADFTSAQDDDAAPAIAGMYDPVYEGEGDEESAEEILARITGTKVDPYLAEAEGDEEEDVEVDAEEETTDGGEEKNDSIVVDKKIVSLSSLPSDTRKILDSLETLRAQAEEFGDQKFITQVGNTITFFTRDFVVAGDEPTRAKVDESLEILKMKKLAGLLTEGEYAKALLKEEEKREGIISFGPFKNVKWYLRYDGEIFLIVTESDDFRKIERGLEITSDEFTDKQIGFLNNEVDELAEKMSEYLTSIGIKNEIYDNPIGYGQEIDNLVVAFDKSDLSKLK